MNSKVQRPQTSFNRSSNEDFSQVNINDLEKYTDMLYEEDYKTKNKGARCIVYLTANPENLVVLMETESCIDLLARTLREEFKKSMELTIYLLYIFYYYSCYQDFHVLLIENSIGDYCMRIVEFQLAKFIIRQGELKRKEEAAKLQPNKDFDKDLDRFLFMVKKQDRILRISFSILMNLAETDKIEKKMVNRGIVEILIKHLDRYNNINLNVVILLFLKKLSIYGVNKDCMVRVGVADHLNKLFDISHDLIFGLSLQNIFNLSFDKNFRLSLLEKKGVFERIIGFFKIPNYRGLVLRILYNMSIEEKSRPVFAETDCLYILYELLIKFPEPIIGIELAALTLNLTTHPKNVQILACDNKINGLLSRAFNNNDYHLIKIVKNIAKFSEDDEINSAFKQYVDQFIKIVYDCEDSEDFQKEMIEILGNIQTNWEEKLESQGLLDFFEKALSKEKIFDDLLVQIILFLGNIGSRSKAAPKIAQTKILELLYSTFESKVYNASVVFSIIYALYQFIAWEDTRKIILAHENLIELVLKCLKCDDSKITYVSLNFLEVVQHFEPKYSEIIKQCKFEIYNRDFVAYLKSLQSQDMQYLDYSPDAYYDDEEEEYEDDDDDNYMYS